MSLKHNFFFRADASTNIGSGHVMRCLLLAEKLVERGQVVHFICRKYAGDMCEYIKSKGHYVHLLSINSFSIEDNNEEEVFSWTNEECHADACRTVEIILESVGCNNKNIMIIDNYCIDERWEFFVRPYVDQIMVVDDLANRRHDCDILLDQNYYRDMKQRYDLLVPEKCKRFFGLEYVLVRDEFFKYAKILKLRAGKIARINVFFGGSDHTNETYKVLNAIKGLPLCMRENVIWDVVVGAANANKKIIQEICCENSNYNYYCQIDYMAELMSKADLAIGAGGSTTWERCCLGLPAIVFCIAENQRRIATDVAEYGAHLFVDYDLEDLEGVKIFQDLMVSLFERSDFLQEIAQKALQLIPPNRLEEIIYELL